MAVRLVLFASNKIKVHGLLCNPCMDDEDKKSLRTTMVRSEMVTRWRFELQTHCLKGNCSAN